ncbi:semaphorin-1A-like [Centruroides sculpturatus]|uniref:semaphorin-1A-like n=1 Tax=Centruroides sculpturatus TaxID=218467 RepID=UPI000C6D023C|nr:semaphorin-1A-like [Centruroides sculpturatus]
MHLMKMKLGYTLNNHRYLVVCVIFLLLLGMPINCAWQEPILPKFTITQLPEDSVMKFVGNQTHVDHFKLLEQDGDHVLIGARNIVYNISIGTLQEKKRLEWYAGENDINMCKVKGKSEVGMILNEPPNFVRSLHHGEFVIGEYFKGCFINKSFFIIYFSVRNIVYNISIGTLQEKKRLEWYAGENDINMCKVKGKSEDECQNYIRVLAKISEDTILVCGTNAFKPLCRHYKQGATDYKKIKENSGEGLCPYDPSHNSTAIFAGTLKERTGSVEILVADVPAVYSRVARVCTKDQGDGTSGVKGKQWTSFLKSRLNCSIPGNFPFYFDEIQSTTHIVEGTYGEEKAQLLYAVFTTPQNSLTGSAVCAFRLQDIQRTFDGDFKGQKDKDSNWLPVPSADVPMPRPGTCVNNSKTLPAQTIQFIHKHTLMDQAVPAFWQYPVVVHTGYSYRLTHIAVDPQIETADGKKYDVLFIGTDNGKVIKALNAGSANANGKVIPVIIEEIQVFSSKTPITNLLVYHTLYNNRLMVVSHREIVTIPLHNCKQRARTCRDCVGLQDPYCAWEKTQKKCTSSRSRFWKSDFYVQNVEEGSDPRCPEDEDITTSESVLQHTDSEIRSTTTSTPTCPPCPQKCICPPNLWFPSSENDITETNNSGRILGTGTTPQRSPHHSASRHDNQLGSHSSSTMEKDDGGNGITGASRGHPYMYTAETLAIAVTTSIVSSLVVGFISGYIFSRRCRNTEVDSPYDDAHYLEQRDARLTCDMNHSDSFLSPSSNNKPINLVLNVPPKNGNGKNANSSADNKPVQKVKKIYL